MFRMTARPWPGLEGCGLCSPWIGVSAIMTHAMCVVMISFWSTVTSIISDRGSGWSRGGMDSGGSEVALYCHSDPLHVQALSLQSRANLARGGNHYKSLMVHIEMIVYNKNPRNTERMQYKMNKCRSQTLYRLDQFLSSCGCHLLPPFTPFLIFAPAAQWKTLETGYV